MLLRHLSLPLSVANVGSARFAVRSLGLQPDARRVLLPLAGSRRRRRGASVGQQFAVSHPQLPAGRHACFRLRLAARAFRIAARRPAAQRRFCSAVLPSLRRITKLEALGPFLFDLDQHPGCAQAKPARSRPAKRRPRGRRAPRAAPRSATHLLPADRRERPGERFHARRIPPPRPFRKPSFLARDQVPLQFRRAAGSSYPHEGNHRLPFGRNVVDRRQNACGLGGGAARPYPRGEPRSLPNPSRPIRGRRPIRRLEGHGAQRRSDGSGVHPRRPRAGGNHLRPVQSPTKLRAGKSR